MEIARSLRNTRNILIVALTAALTIGLMYGLDPSSWSKERGPVARRALALSVRHCPPRYVVLVGPNGAGKTTIIRKLLEEDRFLKPAKRFYTRPPRQDETNSETHQFLTDQEFDVKAARGQMIVSDVHFAGQQAAGALIPMRSGIDIEAIRRSNASSAQRFIFDFHAKHALLWKATKHAAEDSVVICIVPPSLDILESRLTKRHPGEPHIVTAYMQNVKTELGIMERENMCQHRVVNNDLETTNSETRRIVGEPNIAMAC